MGETTAQTVREIEQTRERLEDDIRLLEERLPSPRDLLRKAGAVLAGGAAAVGLTWFVAGRIRAKRAEPQYPAAVRSVLDALPSNISEHVEEAIEDIRDTDRTRMLAIGAVAAMFLMRLAELRRLRRMDHALGAR